MKKDFYTAITAFLLLTLMLLKVSSFHVYTHQDDSEDTIENCTICDVAVVNQNSDFIFTSALVISFTLFLVAYRKVSFVSLNEAPSQFLRFTFFGRPPPPLA